MDASDQALLSRWFRERDEEAFLALITRHAGMVYGACRRVLGNATEAEDVAQECFETLAASGDRHGAWLGAWLHRVATYRSLDRLRAERRRVQRETRYAGNSAASETPTWDDIYGLVDEAIASLPEKLRGPLTEHFLEGKTLESIAISSGVTRQAAHYRVQKGLERIRASLKRRGITVSIVLLGALFCAHAAEAAPPALIARLGKIALSAPVLPPSSGLGLPSSHLSLAGVASVVAVLAIAAAGVFYVLPDAASGGNTLPAVTVPLSPTPGAVKSELLPTAPTDTAPLPPVKEDGDVIFAGRIHGLTVLADGTRAAGAKVVLEGKGILPSRKNAPAFRTETISDGNGEFEFKKVPLEKTGSMFYARMYELAAEKDDLCAMASIYQGHEYRDQYTELILYKNEPISGLVVDAQDNPIAGAEVSVELASFGAPSFGPIGPRASAVTGDNGGFELKRLFPGAYNLRAGAQGYARTLTNRYPTGTTNIRIVLAPVPFLYGHVVEASTREPVEGVKIFASSERTREVSEKPTGADGAFAINLPEGQYELEPVSSPYFLPGTPPSVTIRAGQEPTEVVLEVLKGATVRGRVVDPDGGGQRGEIFIEVTPETPSGPPRSTAADADGSFLIEALGSGACTVEASKGNGRASKRVEVVAGQTYENVDLELTQSKTDSLRGRVVDSANRPVAFASILLSRSADENLWTLADEQGRFAIPVNEADDSPQDPAYLQAVTETAVSAPVGPIARLAGKEAVIRLQPLAQIDGVLKDLSGKGIPAAVIIAVPSSPEGLNVIPLSVDARDKISSRGLADVQGNSTTTFLQGRFTMRPLVPGAYTLCAFMAHSTADSPAASLQVTLSPGQTLSDVALVANTADLAEVEGIVTRAGMPARGQRVEAQGQAGRAVQMSAYSGPDGRYRIENVPPGDVVVMLHNTGGPNRKISWICNTSSRCVPGRRPKSISRLPWARPPSRESSSSTDVLIPPSKCTLNSTTRQLTRTPAQPVMRKGTTRRRTSCLASITSRWCASQTTERGVPA